ncbi:hypothetical protein BOTBODRAFT_151917 [Botryobasidium botryosum FD-172 SS1]|uniref:Palmitoyltransferase n=1 Tax=Botryobasidium botryosum (strain FD-172 SS1) TaxID=930990 RepID=A0A067MZA6_BOTB1|nr:hypothetical protein BOTBODRAFT_151917 [Botryobasidium botryosum FD-172 SS1]
MALLSGLELEPRSENRPTGFRPPYEGEVPLSPRKRFLKRLPLLFVIFLIILPQHSLIRLLTYYYLVAQKSLAYFLLHLTICYSLTFSAVSSLIICVARDPGPVKPTESEGAEFEAGHSVDNGADEEEEGNYGGGELSLAQALMMDSPPPTSHGTLIPLKSNGERRWCRKCSAPKPERAHHCSECNRCVLKMDHHCPWLGSKCVGHRTYPAFLHFLGTVTLLGAYVTYITINPIIDYLSMPLPNGEDTTPLHALFLALMGCIFTLSIGSFLSYHVYLVWTNQTTIEHLTPYLLLRLLPPRPTLLPPESSPNSPLAPPPYSETPAPAPPSSQPLRFSEETLTSAQRRKVRHAHSTIRVYDLGWQRNWTEVLGGGAHLKRRSGRKRWMWIVELLLVGGRGTGDGHTFPHNPSAEEELVELASELAKMD